MVDKIINLGNFILNFELNVNVVENARMNLAMQLDNKIVGNIWVQKTLHFNGYRFLCHVFYCSVKLYTAYLQWWENYVW